MKYYGIGCRKLQLEEGPIETELNKNLLLIMSERAHFHEVTRITEQPGAPKGFLRYSLLTQNLHKPLLEVKDFCTVSCLRLQDFVSKRDS